MGRILTRPFAAVVFTSVLLHLLVFRCERCTEPDDEPEIILPVADAGPDQECKVGQYLIIDGSGSTSGQFKNIKWYNC